MQLKEHAGIKSAVFPLREYDFWMRHKWWKNGCLNVPNWKNGCGCNAGAILMDGARIVEKTMVLVAQEVKALKHFEKLRKYSKMLETT